MPCDNVYTYDFNNHTILNFNAIIDANYLYARAHHLQGQSQLARFDEITTTTDPKVEVKVFGSDGSASGKSTAKTMRYTVGDLDILLVEACKKAAHGIFVTIDEIQKVPLDDVSRICGAFQMASRKGHDILLAVAGLPYSHREIAQHDGCAYMRRAAHEELGLFTPDEVHDAFVEAFGGIRGLKVSRPVLDFLVANSSGHPYMMQLLGYNVVELANARATSAPYALTDADAAEAAHDALTTYELRALDPILDALGTWELRYLEAMASLLDDNLEASTGAIADALGKKPNQVTHYRDQLIRDGIILATTRGKVRFGIPFLRQHLGKARKKTTNEQLLAEWRV